MSVIILEGAFLLLLILIALVVIFGKCVLCLTIIYFTFSFSAMMLYILAGAADVAFTEAVIGVISTVYFIIAIKSISRRCK